MAAISAAVSICRTAREQATIALTARRDIDPDCMLGRRYTTRGQAAIWENQELREWLLTQREHFRRLVKER